MGVDGSGKSTLINKLIKSLSKKYKKIKWKKPMNGPWIHQNILETSYQ